MPLVSEESVPAVLILVTTRAPKVFDGDELSLLQALAAEAALALDRTRRRTRSPKRSSASG